MRKAQLKSWPCGVDRRSVDVDAKPSVCNLSTPDSRLRHSVCVCVRARFWATNLKAVLAPPPRGVLFGGHVNNRHDVPNLSVERERRRGKGRREEESGDSWIKSCCEYI